MTISSDDETKPIYLLYKGEQIQNFDINNLIDKYSDKHIKVLGSTIVDGQRIKYNFDSNDLSSISDELCLSLQSVKEKPFLGVRNKSLHNYTGVEVINIIPNTAADHSEMQEGDTITLIDTQTVGGSCDLSTIIAQYQPGDVVNVTYMHNGVKKSEEAKLGSLSVKTMTWAECRDDKKNDLNLTAENLALEVHPNPSSGLVQFSIDSDSKELIELSLSDLAGKVIERQKLDSFSGTNSDYLDLSSYPNGSYLLTLKQGNVVATEKIVIRH